MGSVHTECSVCAALFPHSWHTVRTVIGANAAICSHSLGTWLAQNHRTVRTMNAGVQGNDPGRHLLRRLPQRQI
jgi:hypothetical protein